MPDNQKKKLSIEQLHQRDLINGMIEGVVNKSISAFFKEDLPEKKSYYYRNVTDIPLSPSFISFIKSQFGLNVAQETSINNETWEQKYFKAKGVIDMLQKDLDLQKEKNSSLMSKLNELYEENKLQIGMIKKLESDLRGYMDKSGTDGK